MSPSIFYREQATHQKGAADAATLENVRVRCQRAADAWGALAVRSERADMARAAAASEKLMNAANENPDRGCTAGSTEDDA